MVGDGAGEGHEDGDGDASALIFSPSFIACARKMS